MNHFYWQPIKFLTAILILISLVLGDLKANLTCYLLIQAPQISTNGKESTLIARDIVYNKLLIALESFKAVWKQQPGNIAALQRYNSEVRKLVTSLREFDLSIEPITEPTLGKDMATSETVVKAPSGPVQPSASPTPGNEIQKREDATEIFLSGPFDDSKKTITLKGIPETWIDTSCSLAVEEITKIDNLLSIDPLDRAVFEIALEKLYVTLSQLPPTTIETTPKGLQK